MKKVIVFVLAIIMSIIIIGCGRPGEEIRELEVNVNLPSDYTAKVIVGTGPGYVKDVQAIASNFHKIYPNITIETKAQPDLNESILRWHNADLSKPGSCPDIFLQEGQTWLALNEGKILKDLDPYIKASVKAKKLDLDDISEQIWVLGKEGYKDNGSQRFIPTNFDQFVTIINTTIFQDARIELPANDWSWTDLISILAKLKNYYSDMGWTHAPSTMHLESDAMMQAIYKSFGVEFFDENNNTTFNNQKTRDAMTFLRSLVDNGYVSRSGGLPLASGQIAIQFQSRPAIATLTNTEKTAEYPNTGYFTVDDYDVRPFPKMNVEKSTGEYFTGGGTIGYSMYSRARDSNAAWAFLSFMTLNKDSLNIWAEKGGNVPIIKSLQDAPASEAVWKTKPTSTLSQDVFISYPERFTPVYFHMNMPSKIRINIYETILTMNMNILKGNNIDSEIDSAIKKVDYQMSRV